MRKLVIITAAVAAVVAVAASSAASQNPVARIATPNTYAGCWGRHGRREQKVVGPEYELINVRADAGRVECVLRAETGDIKIVEPTGDFGWIEVKCERCGRFGRTVAPGQGSAGRWTCYASNSAQACRRGAGRGQRAWWQT
jgi:hypothetical protein